MFYAQRIHDKCYRRASSMPASSSRRDDDGARKGWCLYKMGCRGPSTYNSCSTLKWNCGASFPIASGYACIGCSEKNFWDNGPFYQKLSAIPVPGIESTPDTIGKALLGVSAVGVGAHAISTIARKGIRNLQNPEADPNAGEKK